MKSTSIVYSPEYLKHDAGAFHPESPRRLSAMIEALQRHRLTDSERTLLIPPEAAAEADLRLVHSQSYIDLIRTLSESGGGRLDSDTNVSPDTYRVAKLAAGGAITACNSVLSSDYANSFALVRPPGHHAGVEGRALSASSAGFCIFNNVAIAAKKLIHDGAAEKVAIFDVDVHHGNGTQEVFYGSKAVLYVSFHQDGRTLYPGTGFPDEVGEGEGAGLKVNLPLPPNSNDEIFLGAFDELVEPITRQFHPDFMLVSVGFDAHHADGISRMAFSTYAYTGFFKRIINLAESLCNGRVVAVLEGGYNLKIIGEMFSAVVSTMAKMPFQTEDRRLPAPISATEQTKAMLKEARGALSPYWGI